MACTLFQPHWLLCLNYTGRATRQGHFPLRGLSRESILTDRLEFCGTLKSGGVTDVLVIDKISKKSVFITAAPKRMN